MIKFRYILNTTGVNRCIKREFYLQSTSTYRGYTEKIFQILYESRKPLTVREISRTTGIKSRSVSSVITFNIYAGYIMKIPIY